VLEFNGKDTVYSTKHDTVNTLTVVRDTVRIPAPMNNASKKQIPLVSQKNDKGDNKANVNTGVNSGIIGDNGTQNIISPVQQHPDQRTIAKIEEYFPNKTTPPLQIECSMSSEPSKKFVEELIGLLGKAGYKNVTNMYSMSFGTHKQGFSVDIKTGHIYFQYEE
jgi:hypothetical protein